MYVTKVMHVLVSAVSTVQGTATAAYHPGKFSESSSSLMVNQLL